MPFFVFPTGDDNEEGHSHHHHDFVHWGLIFFCVCVFLYEGWLLFHGGRPLLREFIDAWTFNPKISLGPEFLEMNFLHRLGALLKCVLDLRTGALFKMVASTYIHASLLHIFSNLLVLWMLGDNVEYAMGHWRYLVFFVLTSVLACSGSVLVSTGASFFPSVGASGAIMAVAGAYMVYFSRAKINFFYFALMLWGGFSLPARLVIVFYMGGEFLTAWHDYGTNYGFVAVWAHIFGFLWGVLLSFVFREHPEQELYQPVGTRPYCHNMLAEIHARTKHHHDKHDDPWNH